MIVSDYVAMVEDVSPNDLGHQIAAVVTRALKLPCGPERNELRQLAYALRWFDWHRRNGKITKPVVILAVEPGELAEERRFPPEMPEELTRQAVRGLRSHGSGGPSIQFVSYGR